MNRRVFVGVTSLAWHSFLVGRVADAGAAVVFWRPSAKPFRALSEGELFLFKLRAPADAIVGGGVLDRFVTMRIDDAWAKYGSGLGVPNIDELLRQLRQTRVGAVPSSSSEIGCIIIRKPFFFPEGMWLPFRFPHGVVGGKSYDDNTEEGVWLLEQVRRRASGAGQPTLSSEPSEN